MTSKQRVYLRALANTVESIFQVGKNGMSENFLKQVDEALEARELIKINVLGNASTDVRDICGMIGKETNAYLVQVIGSKCVLYRVSKNHKTIVLPK